MRSTFDIYGHVMAQNVPYGWGVCVPVHVATLGAIGRYH